MTKEVFAGDAAVGRIGSFRCHFLALRRNLAEVSGSVVI